MPIHFNDLDVVSEVEGISSALIVPISQQKEEERMSG
jgi:hypothetical protein